MEMQLLAQFYESLMNKNILIKSGREDIRLVFGKKQLHHLAGFHYIRDVGSVNTYKAKENTLEYLKGDNKFIQSIKSSKFYDTVPDDKIISVKERIYYFNMILWVILNNKCCVWVQGKESLINADYVLIYEYMNKFIQLYIIKNEEDDVYYPVTFFYKTIDTQKEKKLSSFPVNVEISCR